MNSETQLPIFVLVEQIGVAIGEYHPFVQLDDNSKQYHKIANKLLAISSEHSKVQMAVRSFAQTASGGFNKHGQKHLISTVKALFALIDELKQSYATTLAATNKYQPFVDFYKPVLQLQKQLFAATKDTISSQSDVYSLRQAEMIQRYPNHTQWEFDLLSDQEFIQEWKK